LPSHKDLLTVIEIVVAQQTKLKQQKTQLQCLTNCSLAGSSTCDCNVAQTTLAPPPMTGVTLHLAYQVPQAQLNQLSSASQASLGTAPGQDCFLTPAEIAADPYATLLASEFQSFVAAQIGSAGIGPGDINIFGFSSDGDDIPGCNADVAGHTVTLGVSPSMRQSLGNSTAFSDCWLTPAEVASDPDAAAFAQAFVATTAAALGVTPDQIQLNGICAGCRDANLPMGGGCATSTSGR
jgi:hypothetical protein